jgi:Tfp pilus assembly protein PilX
VILRDRSPDKRGFALLITLLLLAFLTLAVFALSSLVKVDGMISSASATQTRARQNALLGLGMGLDALQRAAGPDDVVTAMAGMAGIPPNATSVTRHWCGVWNTDGSQITWLASGAASATASLSAAVQPVTLVSDGSVGVSSPNSEHVSVGKLPIHITQAPGFAGSGIEVGNYAFWVGDEGVKVSAFAPAAAVAPILAATTATSSPTRLRNALATYANAVPKISSYEQLSVLPTPSASLTPSVLGDSFHHVTLTARHISPNGSVETGVLNVNTTSTIVWRSILETYNAAAPAAERLSPTKLSTAATTIASGIAASSAGKRANGPYTSAASFFSSALLSSAITGSGGTTVAQFQTVMVPVLATRSATFRIRGYGDVVNPARPNAVEGTAYCEAIVQRTGTVMPDGSSRRFKVIYFRWLLPSDL